MDGKLANGISPNWLELPEHVMELILKKLNLIDDFVRFGAVSTVWKSLCGRNRHLLPRQLPLLMIPYGGGSNTLSVFSFNMQKGYSVKAQIPQNHQCVGSTEGWVVIEEENHGSLYLWRPFSSTNNKIDLPPLRGTTERYAVLKVVLSADPASSTDFTVMVLLGAGYLLIGQCICFYKSGDPSWRKVKLRINPFRHEVSMNVGIRVGIQDLIYYNRQVYLVDYCGNVFTCDISLPDPIMTLVAKYPPSEDGNTLKFCYLVELSGELLEVRRLIHVLEDESVESLEDWDWKRFSTDGFEIYKLDVNSSKWNEVKSLGDHVLFLSYQASMAIKTSAFYGCVSNYIYYYQERSHVRDFILCDSGIFSFEDGSIERNVVGKLQGIILMEPKLSGF